MRKEATIRIELGSELLLEAVVLRPIGPSENPKLMVCLVLWSLTLVILLKAFCATAAQSSLGLCKHSCRL